MQRDERGVQKTGRIEKSDEPLFAVELIDGIKVAIVGGRLYRVEHGKFTPVDKSNPANKWIVNAWYNTPWAKEDGRYTVVGEHIKGNPYGLDDEFLEKDGRIKIFDKLETKDDIVKYFRTHPAYGIVFFLENGKVDRVVYRTQYGFKWPCREREMQNGE